MEEHEYELLNVFEMLWNVMASNGGNPKEKETAGEVQKIQSLPQDSLENGKSIKGHALTVKLEFLEQM